MSQVYLFNYILRNGNFNDFINFAKFAAAKQNLSIFNAALVYCQRSGAIWVETEYGWNKNGRFLKPNALPIVILKPFGPVEFVYEYGETDGNPEYPPIRLYTQPKIADLEQVDFSKLTYALNNHLIYYGEQPLGRRLYGNVTKSDEPYFIEFYNPNTKKFEVVRTPFGMVINSIMPTSVKFTTVIHELAHLCCGHLTSDAKLKEDQKTKLIKYARTFVAERDKEAEAEAVCELVCLKLGVEYDKKEYLKNYFASGEVPRINMNVVISAADIIYTLLHEVV